MTTFNVKIFARVVYFIAVGCMSGADLLSLEALGHDVQYRTAVELQELGNDVGIGHYIIAGQVWPEEHHQSGIIERPCLRRYSKESLLIELTVRHLAPDGSFVEERSYGRKHSYNGVSYSLASRSPELYGEQKGRPSLPKIFLVKETSLVQAPALPTTLPPLRCGAYPFNRWRSVAHFEVEEELSPQPLTKERDTASPPDALRHATTVAV